MTTVAKTAAVQTVAHQHRIASAVVLLVCGALANPAMAAANDAAFLPLFTFFSNAATGNLTRGICLLGGIIGAGTAAVNGKILLAATGAGIAFRYVVTTNHWCFLHWRNALSCINLSMVKNLFCHAQISKTS